MWEKQILQKIIFIQQQQGISSAIILVTLTPPGKIIFIFDFFNLSGQKIVCIKKALKF